MIDCIHVSCDLRLQLFCVSLPLGPLIALCVHLTDMRVDARRMLWWYRRPVAVIAQDIGTHAHTPLQALSLRILIVVHQCNMHHIEVF